MPLRKPEAGETQAEWMKYCYAELRDSSETERSHEQIVAICLRQWRGDKAEKLVTIVSGLRARLILKGWEDQPRVPAGSPEGGQFGSGSGGGSTGFVSPNVHNLNFDQAVEAINGQDQANLRTVGAEIDKGLGVSTETSSVIGAWADGAENSMMVMAAGGDYDKMRVAMAMKGYLADQKAVLVFQPKEDGEAFMAQFEVSGKAEGVHDALLKDGLAFHTLEPLGGDRYRVHIYGSDQDTLNAVGQAAGARNVNANITYGSGEFIGTTLETGSDREQRDDARRIYEQVIAVGAPGKLSRRDIESTWQASRDRWASLQAKKERLKEESLRVWLHAKRGHWEDQERVPAGSPEGGQFGSGSGGGGDGSTSSASAASLLKPTTATPDQIVAKIPGAAEKVAWAREQLANGVPTDAPVSQGGFKNPDGSWTRERQAVHERVLENTFSPEKVAAATPAEGEQPTLYLLGGRGGSGKSWFTAEGGPIDANQAIVLDNDAFKAALPEYQGWNAALLHEESRHLGMTAEAIARDRGLNIVLDGTMRRDSMKRVEAYQKAGYRVEGYYMHVSPEISTERAIKRFMTEGGRYVPPEYTLNSRSNEASFDKIKDRLDRWEIYDNSGASPRLHSRNR